MEYRWSLLPSADKETIQRLAAALNIPETIAKILVNRGINDFEKAKRYFRPNIEHLHDPFLLDGIQEAVARTIQAIQQREKILIYGDYDVDGTNGVAMLYLFLKELEADVHFHIPDRIKEGYGISKFGIDKAEEQGVKLLISVDCGITAVDQVEYGRSLGIDVIICDHHEPGSILPNAFAVLDPLKPNCQYPFKDLSGCGVGFKLIQAIARKIGRERETQKYLDFVALATTADIVPLVGENRILVKLGLDLINSNPRPGIKALIQSSGWKHGQITTVQIVFMLAPRINAVGRLGDAKRAVELLTCIEPEKATTFAQILEEENRNRRRLDEDTFIHAQELVESYLNMENGAAIVLHQEQWHPGVMGIVASRLVEKYYRPTIMMTTVDGIAKGSARSVEGFDIYQALKKVEDKLIQFGGHKHAAGLSVEVEKLDEFREAFNAAVKELLPDELQNPEIKIDTELDLAEFTPKFVRILRQFAPFGPKNMRPVFLAHNVEVAGQPRIVGKNHLRFKVRHHGIVFDAIGFDLGHLIDRIEPGRKNLDLVFSVDESEWNTMPEETFPQLKVKDLK